MTGWRKRTIIEMAREAGIIALNVECDPSYLPVIERFAALVREDERNQTWTQQHWTDYERSIAAAEREECAKICEKAIASIWEYSPEEVKQIGTNVCNNLAAAIRSRKNT